MERFGFPRPGVVTPRPVMTPKPATVPPPIPGSAGGLTYETLKQAMIIGRDPEAKQTVRSAFYQLSFDAQANLIGEFTKERLAGIGTYIKMYWKDPNNPAPTAAKVWRLIWEKRCVPSAKIITAYFPELRSRASAEQQRDKPDQAPADILAGHLTGLYEFWSVQLYPYDEEGRVSKESVLASPARYLNDEKIGQINESAGLPGLGLHIKGYADFLAQNIWELFFDGKPLKDCGFIKLTPFPATLEF